MSGPRGREMRFRLRLEGGGNLFIPSPGSVDGLPMLCLLLLLLSPLQEPASGGLEPLPAVEDFRLKELSGLVGSRRFPGVFWAHGDSGNPAALFALDRAGKTLARYPVQAPNVDWEDVAIDDAGHLYVGDIGNNLRILPVRVIYELEEPDPGNSQEERLKPIRSFVYRFPPKDSFDAEGLFVDGDSLVLIEKRHDGQEPRLLSLSRVTSGTLKDPVDLVQRGVLPGFKEAVTGASLSQDGRWLAVCSPGVSRVYGRAGSGGWELEAILRHANGAGYEAVAWDGADVVIAAESGRRDRWVNPLGRQGRGGKP